MPTLAEAIQGGIDRVECFILSNNPFVNGSASSLSPAARAVFNDRINQARAIRGCDPDPPSAPPPPPFTGGQCDGEAYLVELDWFVPGGLPENQRTGFVTRGPISNVGFLDVGGSFRVKATSRSVLVGSFSCVNPGGLGPLQERSRATPVIDINAQDLVITVTPCGLDNCGDPPPEYPPPTPINIDIDVTYNPADEPDVDVDVTIPFVFSPITVDLDGSLTVPFTFNFGGFDFTGNFSFNPSAPITINPPRLNPGDGQDIETQPPDQPEETFPPLPTEEKIVGVVVTATTIQQGRVTSYSSPGIPEIYVPRLGSVKFVYSLGGATFFSSDIDVKDRRTFIECPFSQGADAVIASPNTGVDFSFLPIRGFPLATKRDVSRQS